MNHASHDMIPCAGSTEKHEKWVYPMGKQNCLYRRGQMIQSQEVRACHIKVWSTLTETKETFFVSDFVDSD